MHSSIFLVFVTFYLSVIATALPIKPVAPEDASPAYKRGILAVTGRIYHNVERHIIEAVAPVSARATDLDVESEVPSESQIDKRTKSRGNGGAGRRFVKLEERTKSRPSGGAGKRSQDLEARTKTRGGGGANKRTADLEARTKSRGNGGAGRRSATLERRTKSRGNGGAGKRSADLEVRTKSRGNGGAGR